MAGPSISREVADGKSTAAAPVTVPVTVPVTISVRVTVTSTPPPITAAGHPTANPQPVTTVLTTVITTMATPAGTTIGTVGATAAAQHLPTPPLVGPNVGHQAIICFTPATVTLVATGHGPVHLRVVGAATASASGNDRAHLTVAGQTGYYNITYAASSGANLTFHWSTPQGSCS